MRMVKDGHKTSVTLAIGDGSNDVPMLQEAHIGVGISGIPDEHIQIHGHEAACVADYTIAEFSGLPRLIFVHGAGNSIRIGKMVGYFFYKNLAFYLIQFWFSFSALCSGQVLYESWSMTLYNLAFTALPPFVICILDCQFQKQRLEKKNERLFFRTQHGRHFDKWTLLHWFTAAFIHSIGNSYQNFRFFIDSFSILRCLFSDPIFHC